MDHDGIAHRGLSFGRAVDAYHHARPTYPASAVDWCIGEPEVPQVVVDVGAGTGRLTSVLLDLGHDVVAVEPDEDMLDQLVDALGDDPRLDTHVGTADDVPLAAACADAVVAGQAWHWFDETAAAVELARVVRPGGMIAALWNVRDERVDWVRAWGRLVEDVDDTPSGRERLAADDPPDFGAGSVGREHAIFLHDHVLAVDDLVRLAASHSRTIAMAGDARAALLEQVEELARTHPQLVGRERVAMPHEVHCFRATRTA